MIENVQNKHKQAKGPKLWVNIRSLRTKNSPKLFSKYLKDRIWKIKQYLNYILIIINQNILAILWTLLNLKKKWISTPSARPHWLSNHFHFHFDSPWNENKTNELLRVMLTFPTHRHLSNSRKKFLSQKMFSSC